MLSNRKIRAFYLLYVGLVLILLVSQVLREGMFQDGILYAAVSHNLSQGKGSVWDLYYSQSIFTHFREQLPAFFMLETWLYKWLGSSYLIERATCLLAFMLTTWRMFSLWKIYSVSRSEIESFWLPALGFFIMPVVFWSYTNHVQEILMTVFILEACCLVSLALFKEKTPHWMLFLSGSVLLFACLFKGVQAAFPLVIPFLFGLFIRKQALKARLVNSAWMLAGWIVPTVVLFLYAPTRNAILGNFEARLVRTFSGVMNTRGSHFHLTFELMQDVAPALILCLVFAWLTRRFKLDTYYWKRSWFFLLIGLAGTLPLQVTTEQRGFYLLPGLPFIAFAFAFPVAAQVYRWVLSEQSRFFVQIIEGLAIVCIIVGIGRAVYLFEKPQRDEELLADVHRIGQYLGKETVVGIDLELTQHWSFRHYLIRFYNVSTDHQQLQKYPIFISQTANPPAEYSPSSLKLQTVKLYRKFK